MDLLLKDDEMLSARENQLIGMSYEAALLPTWQDVLRELAAYTGRSQRPHGGHFLTEPSVRRSLVTACLRRIFSEVEGSSQAKLMRLLAGLTVDFEHIERMPASHTHMGICLPET